MEVDHQLGAFWKIVFLLALRLSVTHERYTLHDNEEGLCYERSLCQVPHPFRLGRLPLCMCNNRCHIFGDCCKDAAADEDIGSRYNLEAIRGSLTCRSIQQNSETIYYVNKCPEHADDLSKERCEQESNLLEDVLAKVPVSGANTGLVFKNIYCAHCHRANAIERLIFWELAIDCGEVEGSFKPPGFEDWPESPELPVTTMEPENPDRVNVTNTLQSEDLERCRKTLLPPEELEGPHSCQVIIDQCPPDWPDDAVADGCHNSYSNHTYTSSEIFKNAFCANCNNIAEYWLSCDARKFIITHRTSLFSLRILLDLNDGRLTQLKTLGYKEFAFVAEASIGNCPDGAAIDLTRGVCRPVFCESGSHLTNEGTCERDVLIAMDIESIVGNNGTIFSAPGPVNCPLTSLKISEYILHENGTLDIPAHDLTLQPEQYVVRQNGSEVAVCASYLTVSQNNLDEYLVEGYLTLIGGTLSLLGLLIVFVVYSMIPELRNLPGKCLMNLVAALFLAMFLFLLMAIPKPKSKLCLLSATGAHFFYLVAFFWMNVLGFDIWRTFQFKSLSHQSHHSRKQLIIYHLYAWLTPLLIVTIAVLVDNDVIPAKDGIKPEYGEVYCWFTTKWGLFAFFVAPAVVLIAANIIFFSLSIFSICRTSQATGAVSSDHGLSRKRHLLLNIKLSAIMGLTWTFGFLANALPKYSVLWYFFVVTCSLQGVIICLGFVCNQKTLRLLKSKVQKPVITSSTKSSSLS